jgi:hypothetical protein
MSIGSGISMVSSGFENLFYEINKVNDATEEGTSSWTDYAASMTSIFGGMLQLVSPFIEIIGLMVVKKAATDAMTKSDKKNAEE